MTEFARYFEALTGHTPLRWQARFFERISTGAIPSACDLPTGLGKTSVIPIWLIALATQNRNSGISLPRRLVYIVNRRTVVDQATDVVEGIRSRLRSPGDERWVGHKEILHEFSSRLRALCAMNRDNDVLGVSTLRGEMADNEEWKGDPARPAIIVGTIDMVGSKLLFSGYGDGRYHRAHHAGLIGQDTLIIHDEAHLSPAFDELLSEVEKEQKLARMRSPDAESRPIRIMRLSATTRVRGKADEAEGLFSLKEDDLADAVVNQRLKAKKRLILAEAESTGKKESEFVDIIARTAFSHESKNCRVLVYVSTPEMAKAVRDAIVSLVDEHGRETGDRTTEGNAFERVSLLTGTIRGYERDQRANSKLFQAFKSDPNRPVQLDNTLYLVSTSAGEVGTDWDADHLVCDLGTLDAMAQRFGRVNRLGVDKDGRPREASVTVVVQNIQKSKEPTKDKATKGNAEDDKRATQSKLAGAITQTREILHQIQLMGGDLSPDGLRNVLSREDAQAAFSPSSLVLQATDILFDNLALTSIQKNLPGRREVGPYLHGVAEWEPPETYIAWRTEVAELAKADVLDDDLEDIIDAFPLRAAERLRERADRVLGQLQVMAERLRKNSALPAADQNPKVIVLKQDSIHWATLSDIAPVDKNGEDAAIRLLAFATVVLPVEAGGLTDDGLLQGAAGAPKNAKALDVAETKTDGQRVRQRVFATGEEEAALMGDRVLDDMMTVLRIALTDSEENSNDNNHRILEYRVAKGEGREPGRSVELVAHNTDVGEKAWQIARTLELSDELSDALKMAGDMHDIGKANPIWQTYACNPNGKPLLAKSTRYRQPRVLGGYRHEFGSLLEAQSCQDLRCNPERDLILHLVAAHHGWARPHFESQPFGGENSAAEMIRCFGQLQQRFGRWGLAWLESLLRCADIAASSTAAKRDAIKRESVISP